MVVSWQNLKDQGRVQYEQGNFAEALSLYQQASSAATRSVTSSSITAGVLDLQVLLSNIVACRLKLGQNERALQDAQECIHLNPSWSKAHVRLASAYIAIGGRSNDACNALQTALRHDPSNATARQMLLQQLQRDHQPQQQQQQQRNPDMDQGVAERFPTDTVPTTTTRLDEDLDDTLSLRDRFQADWGRLKHWYASQSDARQTGIKIFIGLLALYISFGGRFGLAGTGPTAGGSYLAHDYGVNHQNQRRATSSYHGNHQQQQDYYVPTRPSSSSSSDQGLSRQSDDSSKDNGIRYGDFNHKFRSSLIINHWTRRTRSTYSYTNDLKIMVVVIVVAYICRINGIHQMPIPGGILYRGWFGGRPPQPRQNGGWL